MRARTWLSAGFLVALLAACCGTALAESDGTTPLLWAVHNNDIDAVDRLIKAGADVNVKNEYGVTPMSEAAVNGNTTIIEKLLKAGANADSPSADGMTALYEINRPAANALSYLVTYDGTPAGGVVAEIELDTTAELRILGSGTGRAHERGAARGLAPDPG